MECPVCFHEKINIISCLDCKNKFCNDCIHTWFETTQTCPTCRSPTGFASSCKIKQTWVEPFIKIPFEVSVNTCELNIEEHEIPCLLDIVKQDLPDGYYLSSINRPRKDLFVALFRFPNGPRTTARHRIRL